MPGVNCNGRSSASRSCSWVAIWSNGFAYRRVRRARISRVVVVAGCHRGEHPQRDAARAPHSGQPLRQRVVEVDLAPVGESQQQRRHVGGRHRPVAEVHLRRSRNTRRGLPVRLLEHRPAGDLHLHDRGPYAVLRQRIADEPVDPRPRALRGRRRRRTGGHDEPHQHTYDAQHPRKRDLSSLDPLHHGRSIDERKPARHSPRKITRVIFRAPVDVPLWSLASSPRTGSDA